MPTADVDVLDRTLARSLVKAILTEAADPSTGADLSRRMLEGL